jgi:hypothetical protein
MAGWRFETGGGKYFLSSTPVQTGIGTQASFCKMVPWLCPRIKRLRCGFASRSHLVLRLRISRTIRLLIRAWMAYEVRGKRGELFNLLKPSGNFTYDQV